jgi:hypothetical protein
MIELYDFIVKISREKISNRKCQFTWHYYYYYYTVNVFLFTTQYDGIRKQ